LAQKKSVAKKSKWKRRLWTVLKWAVAAGAAVYLWFVVQLVLLRWIDPVFTMVQAQRRVESWFAKGPYEKRRVQIPLKRVSLDLQHAVIAAEDARFYQHNGIDWQVIEELIEDDLFEDGKLGRGGSTITQQLIKNLFATTHRSWIRKGLEFALAPAAEAILSKDRILELYLNNIEWGPNGVFGAEAAAQFHYKTSAARLTREQAARLAVCVPSPRMNW
jgi:monofunctional glycosyltransferase